MTWFKVSDDFAFHGKVVAAGAAMATWVRAGAWSAQQLTDGFIPDHIAALLGPKRDASKLVTVGLWEAAEGGYRFHDWGDYQPTRAEVEDKRAKRQAAGRKGGVRSGEARRSTTGEATGEANAEANASRSVHTRANTRPDPTRPTNSSAPSERAAEPPAAAPVPAEESEGQRVNRLTKVFTDRVPMSNFPAVSGVIKKAVRAAPQGKPLYDDAQISEALIRLASDGRSVTVDTLRMELDGLPPLVSRQRQANTDDRIAAVQALKRGPRQASTSDQLALGG